MPCCVRGATALARMLSLDCAAKADQLELEFADHVLQPEWRIEEAGICEVSIANTMCR